MKKIKNILFSRTRKPKDEQWVWERRKACAPCEFNTKNMERIPLGKRILKSLSDFYSFICGKQEDDNLGSCTACESCSIFYKSNEITEVCPVNKWKI